MIERVQRYLTLGATLAVIAAGIYYLEGQRSGKATEVSNADIKPATHMSESEKTLRYPRVKELVGIRGFLNSPELKLADVVGKKIILVDFWTYSCINCQRTLPYLNDWYEKYHDEGLEIVGIHTPEFAFEKDRDNVQAAIAKYGIKYPVVLDNDYATWRAYANRYWPRKYLVDIDGYIVYDHIGEGAYSETERRIQELLRQRQARLATPETITTTITSPQASPAAAGSPETYFGAMRNEVLGNGRAGALGEQVFIPVASLARSRLYLGGTWDIQAEFAQNRTAAATITYRYNAREVYLVAGADQPAKLQVRRDGRPLDAGNAGEDVIVDSTESTVTITGNRLYKLIHDETPGEHTLEITIEKPGLNVFTFTFG